MHLGEQLLILVESIRKSLSLALAGLRPAQVFSIDPAPQVIPLSNKDRRIAGQQSLP